jgi:DNA repair exonuclease SbcCD ATPase subunit
MRISRIQLRDVKRYRDLQIDLAPALTIIRGPNEAGKSTISRAIELGLTGSVGGSDPGTAAALDGFRSWDAEATARPTITLDFTIDGEGPSGEERSGSIVKAFGPGGTAQLTIDGESVSDPAAVDASLADLTGLPTPAFFRSTAQVRRGELENLDRSETTLRQRLAASISAADRDTLSAIAELRQTLADLNARGERDPGRLAVAEEAVARSEVTVAAGEEQLARLVADRQALGGAEDASTSAEETLAERRELLEQARNAELLTAEHTAATERHARYVEAVAAAGELAKLRDSHPSPNPLPVIRQTVERLRALDTKIVELRAMLSGEVKVNYEVTAATTTWRPIALAALITVIIGVGLAVAGQLVAGLTTLTYVGIGAAILGVVLGLVAMRTRKAARDFRKQQQMAEGEVERRLRGRSQMEAELLQAEKDSAAQLQGVGLPDLAAAEELLGREEAHVAAIDQLNAQLEGLVGREPVETLASSRDVAARQVAESTAKLADLEPESREPGARQRYETEVASAQAAVDEARTVEATMRANVEANPVDAERVAGEAERLGVYREQLADVQRRIRVNQGAIDGLERATEVTMARATRYLEKRMTGAVARITDGRYRRVRIDDETLDISVVAPEKGDWVDVRELSDGTIGQIYLAARLGLIRYATGDRRPPLVLDDPFVTFDDAHATRGFELLRELTGDHQVIYLTSTDRYDAAADAVVELPGPTAVDQGADGAGPAATA